MKSAAVAKGLYFIGFFLNTNQKQRKALLQIITKSQLQALIEIVYNVVHGFGRISEQDKKYLRKFQVLIRRIIIKRLSKRQRIDLLSKHLNLIYKLIGVIRKHVSIQWQES